MKTGLFIFLFFLLGPIMQAQTTHYDRAAPIIEGEVQTVRFNQKVIVRMKQKDYYDIEITLDHKDPGKKVITQIHTNPESYRKSKSGRRNVISYYGTTSSGGRVRIIYPTDKSSFWLITEFFPDGRIKTGAIYEK